MSAHVNTSLEKKRKYARKEDVAEMVIACLVKVSGWKGRHVSPGPQVTCECLI